MIFTRLFKWLVKGEQEPTFADHYEKAVEMLKQPKQTSYKRIAVKKGKRRYWLEFIKYDNGAKVRNNLGRLRR